LILETSGRVGQVAVAQGASLSAVRRLDEVRRHARDLAPTVAELLHQQGWRPHDLQAVFVSRGPGSYTGLRVGIMSAKTLAFATGCALLAIDTFAAIARQAPADVTSLDVMADAQQEKVYVQRFERPSPAADPVPASALAIVPLASWLAGLGPAARVSGPGLRVYRSQLPAEVHPVDEAAWDPQAESLLQIGLRRYLAAERDDVWAAEPLYLRPSAAEEKWSNLGGGRS
jgi:tRNA threonylcarbamoyladenosine biosynthesis protein TsaB